MSEQAHGPVRCPACGQQALPMETRCLYCNTRLRKGTPVETTTGDAIQVSPGPLALAEGKCPGCGKELPEKAVLCIECGYDTRTGRKRATIRGHDEVELEPDTPRRKRTQGRERLPARFGKVQLGLGFHYARLILTQLAVLVMVGLVCYSLTARPTGDDSVLFIGGLATAGILLLAAVLGMVGSGLCLWVDRDSRAWGLIFASLLLDVLALPLVVYLYLTALPALIGWAVQFASWILFMLFLRRVARYIDRPGEANEIMALITRGVALLVAVPLFLILLGQFAYIYAVFSPGTARALLMVSTLVIIVQFFFLFKLFVSIFGNIQTLRAAIASRLPETVRQSDAPPPSSGE